MRCGGGVGELAAFGGEGDAARVALEQDHAQVRLQPAHVVADRAGGEVQFLGRVGEVLVPGGGREDAEGGQQVGAQVHGSRDSNLICG